MNKDRQGKSPYVGLAILLGILMVVGIAWGVESNNSASPAASSDVFTPAHPSLSSAVREFFNIRPTPVQPIQYTHTVHINKVKMDCVNCHEGVEKGPNAMIPNINKCWECHEDFHDRPELQKIADYHAKGQDIPWQRVYGFPAISHVRFNHAPHIRNNVACATCHGDIPSMTTAQRVVNHTMGFCVQCHEQKKAPNDCMTCHY
jgi:hypothetical protein